MKGTTNAIRQRFAEMAYIDVEDVDVPLQYNCPTRVSSTSSHTSYNNGRKSKSFLAGDSNIPYIANQHVLGSTTTGNFYDHPDTVVIQSTMDLSNLITTNLPPGSRFSVAFYTNMGSSMAQVIKDGIVAEARVNADGSITAIFDTNLKRIQPTKSASSGSVTLNTRLFVTDILHIGNGGGN